MADGNLLLKLRDKTKKKSGKKGHERIRSLQFIPMNMNRIISPIKIKS